MSPRDPHDAPARPTLRAKLRFLARRAVALLALVCVAATLLPVVSDASWWFRIFDFPRVGLLGLSAAGFGATSLLYRRELAGALRRPAQPHPGRPSAVLRRRAAAAFLLAFLLVAVWQSVYLVRYTPLAPREVRDTSPALPEVARLRVMTANVLYSNTQTDRFLRLVREEGPDILFMTEVNDFWAQATAGLAADYPYAVHEPLSRGRGIALYSRLPLLDPIVRYMVQGDRPSLAARVDLTPALLNPNTDADVAPRELLFYGLHPSPPGLDRGDGTRKDSAKRDAEAVLVAAEIAAAREADPALPVLVLGDLNDPPWSRTNRAFRRTAGLLEPRRGRGIVNTFHAQIPIARWPIDYILVSEHFLIAEFRRGPRFGSDHFPLIAELAISPAAPRVQSPEAPDPIDEDLARERAVRGLRDAHETGTAPPSRPSPAPSAQQP